MSKSLHNKLKALSKRLGHPHAYKRASKDFIKEWVRSNGTVSKLPKYWKNRLSRRRHVRRNPPVTNREIVAEVELHAHKIAIAQFEAEKSCYKEIENLHKELLKLLDRAKIHGVYGDAVDAYNAGLKKRPVAKVKDIILHGRGMMPLKLARNPQRRRKVHRNGHCFARQKDPPFTLFKPKPMEEREEEQEQVAYAPPRMRVLPRIEKYTEPSVPVKLFPDEDERPLAIAANRKKRRRR